MSLDGFMRKPGIPDVHTPTVPMCNIYITGSQYRLQGDAWKEMGKVECAGVKLLLMVLLCPSCEGCSCLPLLRQMEVAGLGELSNQITANIFSIAHYLATTNSFWSAWERTECGWALANSYNAFSLCRASVEETRDWKVGRVGIHICSSYKWFGKMWPRKHGNN